MTTNLEESSCAKTLSIYQPLVFACLIKDTFEAITHPEICRAIVPHTPPFRQALSIKAY